MKALIVPMYNRFTPENKSSVLNNLYNKLLLSRITNFSDLSLNKNNFFTIVKTIFHEVFNNIIIVRRQIFYI